jgi:excisionase family DNA binding protein
MSGKPRQHQLVNVAGLSKALGVPRSWIYDRTRQGPDAIPFYRFGLHIRFDVDEVKNFFKSKGKGI